MRAIVPTLNPADVGSSASNLVEAILLLVERGVIKSLDRANTPANELAEAARVELSTSTFGPATRQLVVYFQLEQGLGANLRGLVEEITAHRLNSFLKEFKVLDESSTQEFTVKGVISEASGRPAKGLVVRAFDRDLRKIEPVGKATVTGPDGRFEIPYSGKEFSRAEKDSADLIIRVYSSQAKPEKDAHLVESSTLFNAPAEAELNLRLPDTAIRQSELERHCAAITPLLTRQANDGSDLQISDLTDEDIDFVVGEMGVEREQIRLLVLAAKLAQNEKFPRQEGTTTGSPGFIAFYGWFRKGLPTDLRLLWALPISRLTDDLKAAMTENIVPRLTGKELDELIGIVTAQAVDHALKPSAKGERASLGDIVTMSSIQLDARKRFRLARVLLDSPAADADTLARHLEAEGFSPSDADRIQFLHDVSTLATGHLPLMRELKAVADREPTFRGMEALTTLNVADWTDLVRRTGLSADVAGETEEEKTITFATILSDAIESRYPISVLSHRIQHGDFKLGDTVKNDLSTFFTRNPTFVFQDKTQPARVRLESPDMDFSGISNLDKVKESVLQIDRLKKVTSRTQEIAALYRDGFHSGASIAITPAEEFALRYEAAFGEARAREIHANGRQVYDTSLLLITKYFGQLNSAQPYGTSGTDTLAERPVQSPEWRELFGPLDFCECQHCQSIYSPTAYFADVLNFLRRGPVLEGRTPFQVLLGRRPELAELELTCDNTNTKMPFIDLVNETLEHAVAPLVPIDVSPAGGRTMAAVVDELDHTLLPQEVKAVLASVKPPVASAATVRVGRPGAVWRIIDDGRRWLVNYSAASLEVVQRRTSVEIPVDVTHQAVQDLDAGTVPPEIRDRIAFRGLIRPKGNGLPSPTNFTSTVVTAGAEWQLTWDYVLTVTLRQDFLSSVVVLSSGSDELARVAVSSDVQSVLAELDGGSIPIEIQRKLAAVDGALSLRVVQARSEWELVITRSAKVTYRTDALRIVVLALQTTWREEELYAHPEHTNTIAYEKLSKAVYPWTLPFDLWLEEARVYLQHLGVPRHQLMSILFSAGARADAMKDPAIVNEYLGLSSLEADLITGVLRRDPNRPLTLGAQDRPWELWGYGPQTVSIPDPSGGSTPILGRWDAVLSRADVFMKQAGLTYLELLDLLETYFVNTQRKLSLVSTDTSDPATCDVAKLAIKGLDTTGWLETLKKIHRFIRLWKKCSCSMKDLDRSLMALSAGGGAGQADISAKFLASFAHATQLSTRLNVSAPLVMNWWAETIDTAVYYDHTLPGQPPIPSVYDRVFLDRTVVVQGQDIFKLDNARRELDYLTAGGNEQTISGSGLAVSTALGIRQEDLTLLLALTAADLKKLLGYTGATDDAQLAAFLRTSVASLTAGANYPNSPVHDRLRLSTLSLLFRLVSYAKAMKLSIHDFLALWRLTGQPAILSLSSVTVQFADWVTAIESSGLTIPELDYFLRDQFVSTSSIAPDPGEIAVVLADIRDGLQKVEAEQTFAPDPTGEVTRQKLALILSAGDVEAAMAILGGTTTLSAANQRARIDAYFSTSSHPPAEFLSDVVDAKSRLVGTAALPAGRQRYEYVERELVDYLKQSVITTALSAATGIEVGMVVRLLRNDLSIPGQPNRKALQAFVDPAFVTSDRNVAITESGFSSQFRTYRLLHKVAMLVQRWKLTVVELSWLSGSRRSIRWLDWNTLPTTSQQPAASFDAWLHLWELIQLRDQLPAGKTVLDELLSLAWNSTATESLLLRRLSELLRWDLDDLTFLVGNQVFGFTFPTAYRDEVAISRLLECFRVLKRLGASAPRAKSWTKAVLSAAESEEIKSVARSKYEAQSWFEVSPPLRNLLRDRQRKALVDFLNIHPLADTQGRPLWKDANGLYAYFLIDVEMSPCMKTSRLKQAISSAQLFTQRVLMNLEPETALNDSQAQEWKQWRKQYRVWEANRKIFLYPENWIEPELRDDKTEFFEELESEVLQDEITADKVEETYQHYLEKLDQVARIEIVGLYQQQDGKDVLHVFGRTRGLPCIYYYRRNEDNLWTAWERVDLDIESDHLMPVMWHHRLYLFWPIFTEKGVVPTDDKERANNEEPRKRLEIKLAWSQYKGRRWLPKKLSSNALKPGSTFENPDTPDYSFKTRVQQGPVGEQLSIECYGPVTQLQPAPAPSTPQITTNVQYLVTFVKHTFDYGMIIQFQINGAAPLTAARSKIQVQVKNQISGALVETLSLNASGETVDSNGGAFTVHNDSNPLDCFLVSDAFSMVDISDKWERFPGKLGVTVALAPWSPPPPQVTATKPTYTTDPWQGLGEFTFDSCSNDLVAWKTGEGYLPLQPAILEPLQGTEYENMMLKDLNDTPALGPNALLAQTPGTFRLLGPHQTYDARAVSFPFFFQDDLRTYLVTRPTAGASGGIPIKFTAFFHPWMCEFWKSFSLNGVGGLLTLANQQFIDQPARFLTYRPDASRVDLASTPFEEVDFRVDGAYSAYNWELFFHIPFLIAIQLNRNQRFEEAQQWFHYVFDPLSPAESASLSEGASRFWKVSPFHELAKHRPITLQELLKEAQELNTQISIWQQRPFHPHVIARRRLLAYMKNVVMKYVDNLLDWGDMLFGRDTIESINEATQLYILAANILGRRPETIPSRAVVPAQTFNSLVDEPSGLDAFTNAMVAIEGFIFPSAPPSQPPMDPLEMSYFCLAGNDQLLEYWDRVADRLFKVRHCMNIEGVERELPLFEPPIDPALLVRAAAAGVDLTSVLNDLNMPLPHHRFTVMFQKAVELCSEVKSLGTAFLGALEKRDAEMLALLRSEQEVALLKAIRDVRQQQLKEAEENEKALEEALNVLLARKRHYENLVNSGEAKGGSSPMGGLVQAGGGSLKLNRNEQEQLTLSETGLQMQAAQSVIEYLGGILSLIPDTKAAAPTSAGTTFGGSNIGGALKAVGGFFGAMASISHSEAALSGLKGGHLRRSEEWAFQLELANQEEIQINRQLAAANIRVALAEKELENHDRQIENAGAVDDAMRNKFTNSELYGWMIGQLSTLYFQGYNLAYNAAKKAERAYRFELGIESSSFVQYGYWDSLKKGLLAGDKLSHDLRRLDMSYSDLNRREYEITKHVSLLMLDPLALLDLKMTGTCQVDLPEVLFDLDCPGHYMRRIKSVGVTIPCVVGPYASLNCKLTLLKSETRYKTTTAPGYARTGSQDTRFADYLGAVNAMVTSNAQNDSGLFEANLRDERYLPFEGSGAISQWRLQLPKEFPQFDYESISDVILHLRYTARDGGDGFRSDVNLWLQNNLNSILQPPGGNLARFFSMRHEFPSEWNRFMTLASANGDHEQKLILTKDRFPFFAQTKTLTVWKVDLFGLPKPKSTLDLGSLLVTPPQGTAINLAAGTKVGELEHVVSPNNVDAVVSDDVQKAQWTLKVAQADIQQTIDPIHDLYLVCHYRMSK